MLGAKVGSVEVQDGAVHVAYENAAGEAQELVVDKKLVDGKTLLACFDTVARDNARTPMQWDDTQNAGFTTGKPWLGLNPNYTDINVKAALADKDSVFYYYQQLIKLRHTYPIIVYGRFRPLLEDSGEIYAYQRELDGQVLTVAANWTERTSVTTS